MRDRDGVYGSGYRKRLRTMGVRDHPTAPRSPWQNPFAERVIGSIRRECLDHVVVMGASHLCQLLKAYAGYYNRARTHWPLSKDCPIHRPVQSAGMITASPIVGGLHHVYVRA